MREPIEEVMKLFNILSWIIGIALTLVLGIVGYFALEFVAETIVALIF